MTPEDRELLSECLVTLRHADVFICSREKMHPDGRDLYRELVRKLAARLKVEAAAHAP